MAFNNFIQNIRFVTGSFAKIANFLTLAIIYLGKIAKSRSFKISLGSFAILISIAIATPLLLDNSLLKFKIEQKISEISKSNFSINGKLEIKFIPYPVIIANDVVMYNLIDQDEKNSKNARYFNFYARSITSKIPLFGISSNSFTSGIKIEDAILESYEDNLYNKNEESPFLKAIKSANITLRDVEKINMGQGISGKIFAIDRVAADQFSILNIPKISLINANFIRYDKLLREKRFEAINGYLKLSYNKIRSELEFASNKIKSKIDASINVGKNFTSPSYIDLVSPAIISRIEGSFIKVPQTIDDIDFNGKLIADISELKSFYGSYINNYDLTFNKLSYNSKDIKISADVKNIAKEMSVDNILINSSIINGQGQASLNLGREIPIIDLSLDLKNLDLDSIWSGETLTLEKIQSYIKYFPNKTKKEGNEIKKSKEDQAITQQNAPIEANEKSKLLNIKDETAYKNKEKSENDIDDQEKIDIQEISDNIKNIDFTAEIKIDSVKYLGGEIKESDLYITVTKGGQIMILPLIFKTPGGGTFRVIGVFDNNSEVPKFVGKIDTKGESLKDLFNWFDLSTQNLKIENLKKYSIYSDILLLPTTIIFNNLYLNLGEGSSEFSGNIKIVRDKSKSKNVTLDLAGTYFNVDDFFLTSGQNIYLSPGSFLTKVLWLNNITSRHILKLKFDKLIYKGENFKDQSIAVRIGRGYFEVSDMKLNSTNTKLEANLILDISGDTPKFSARIYADKFTYDSKNNNIEVDSSFKQDENLQRQDFFDQIFALPSLKGFDGIINLHLKEVLIDEMLLDEVKIYGELRDGSIKNFEVSCKALEGDLKYEGLINVGALKVLSGTITATNINFGTILAKITGNNNISTTGNLSAAFSASAAIKEDFFRKLSAKIIFVTKPIEIKGYGLSDLIKKMFVATIKSEKINDPEAIINDQNLITKFSEAKGSINIIDENNANFRADLKAPALNSIFSGSFNIKNKQANGLLNSLFLTGNRKKQIPINVATNLIYNDNSFSQITNLDQVRQYFNLPTLHSTREEDKNTPKNTNQENIDFTKDFNKEENGDQKQ